MVAVAVAVAVLAVVEMAAARGPGSDWQIKL